MTFTCKSDNICHIVRVNRFLSEGPWHFAMKLKAEWDDQQVFLLQKKNAFWHVFTILSAFITQNVLCNWKEICSWITCVIIKTEREREKEGPEAASLNSISSAGSHWPMEQWWEQKSAKCDNDISLIRHVLTKSVSCMYLHWGKIRQMRTYN